MTSNNNPTSPVLNSRDQLSAQLRSLTYAVDHTGTNPANAVVERRTLTDENRGEYNHIIPKAAPFYVESMRIVHTQTNDELVLGRDFYCVGTFIKATTNVVNMKHIAWCVIFDDPRVAGEYELRYQTVGGEFVLDSREMAEILANHMENPRITDWERIVGRPLAFPPLPHTVDATELVGVGGIEERLTNIRDEIRALRNDEEMNHPGYSEVLSELLRMHSKQNDFEDRLENFRRDNNSSLGAFVESIRERLDGIERRYPEADAELRRELTQQLTTLSSELGLRITNLGTDFTNAIAQAKQEAIGAANTVTDNAIRGLAATVDLKDAEVRALVTALSNTLSESTSRLSREIANVDDKLTQAKESLTTSISSSAAASLRSSKEYTDGEIGKLRAEVANLISSSNNVNAATQTAIESKYTELLAKINANKTNIATNRAEIDAIIREMETTLVGADVALGVRIDKLAEAMRQGLTQADTKMATMVSNMSALELRSVKTIGDQDVMGNKYFRGLYVTNENGTSKVRHALDQSKHHLQFYYTGPGNMANNVKPFTMNFQEQRAYFGNEKFAFISDVDSRVEALRRDLTTASNTTTALHQQQETRLNALNNEISATKALIPPVERKIDGLIANLSGDVRQQLAASNALTESLGRLEARLNGNEFVKTAGDQTITGTKTFKNQIRLRAAEDDNKVGFMSLSGNTLKLFNPYANRSLELRNNGDVYSGNDQLATVNALNAAKSALESRLTALQNTLTNDVVKTTGDQTIGGTKTFTSTVKLTDNSGRNFGKIGRWHDGVFLKNEVTTKELKLRDDGKIVYDNKRVLLETDSADILNSVNPAIERLKAELAKYVTLATNQEITGSKTFTQDIQLRRNNETSWAIHINPANGIWLHNKKAGAFMGLQNDGIPRVNGGPREGAFLTEGMWGPSTDQNDGNRVRNRVIRGEDNGSVKIGHRIYLAWDGKGGSIGVGGSTDRHRNGGIGIFNNSEQGIGIYTKNVDRKMILDVDAYLESVDYRTHSDRRLKENIKPIENALDICNQIDGYTYNLKEDGTRNAGVIAQEVKAVFPEVVNGQETSDDILTVNYNGLVGMLIGAVNQLTERVKELEAKVG